MKSYFNLFIHQSCLIQCVRGNKCYAIGCDDFNFLPWILLASSQKVPVTAKILWALTGMVWGVCYTPHERYPCDRILFRCVKTGFLVSHSLNLIGSLLYSPQPPQLPRETLWIGWIRSWGWPTPPTSAHIVPEMTLTGRKTSNLAGCAQNLSKTL